MKECAKCGKANLPTRKYCLRCGASLISAPKPDAQKPAPEPVAPETPPKDVSATSDDKWVRPSEVSTDRVRTSAPKAKSELEKAREAFAKAEEVGIEEADSGIVETRMLRASEVRELLESAAEFEAQPPPMPAQPEMTEPGAPPPPAAPPMPTPKTLEEGILGAKSSLVDKPAPPPEPTPPTEPIIAPGGTPAPAAPASPNASAPPAAKPPPAAPAPAPAPARAPAPAAVAPISVPISEQVIPEVEVIEMKIPDSEYLKDGKISSTLTDLRHLHVELKQANADLDTVTAHLENDVQNCRN
ncbi:MAG: zinc ribbon domain-containing protein, partial [Candidatus Thorarchaeota archaeon]